MKFDFIIGNPPYQDETLGDNKGFAPPIYNKFIDESYRIADRVLLIHPGRFLFNAGSTPKDWNARMLNDSHLKVITYEPDCRVYFPNQDIKGGIAITYHDVKKEFGAISIFTPYEELNSILHKCFPTDQIHGLNEIAVSSYAYHFTDELHVDFPFAKYKEVDGKNVGRLSKGHDYDLKSNVFDSLPEVFLDSIPDKNNSEYIKMIGRQNNNRVYKYIKRKYISDVSNFEYYKIFIAKANGDGALGNIASPIIGEPGVGSTESFLSIGAFKTIEEVTNAKKYVVSKFARAMLGILKVTQDITPEKFKYVPLQNFTSKSDIDWSKSSSDIDKQLYKKYGLNAEEICFIETHVKEME